VDGTGKYPIPGLIEMHAHTSKTRASALGFFVVHGVTTVRDQGSEHAEVLRWRNEIRAGERIGPRMLIALRGRLFQREALDALLAAVAAMPDQRVNDWVR
jgi:imidazolonepropionase-like amidohydrolase